MWTQLGHSDFCSRMYWIRMANSNMNTTRPHQRKTLIFSEVIALESVRGISLPGLIRFQKPNSLIILWPAVDGISLETSKNLQLVGELICNRLAARCFWERCQDLQNTTQRRCTLWLAVTCWPYLHYYLHASPSWSHHRCPSAIDYLSCLLFLKI